MRRPERALRPLRFTPAPVGPAIRETDDSAGLAARRDRLYRLSLATADVTAAFLALLLTIFVLGDDRPGPLLLAGIPLLIVVAGKLMGLYDRDELVIRKSTIDEAPLLLQLTTFCTLAIWLLEDALLAGDLGKPQVVGLWALLFGFVGVGRWAARAVARTIAEPERCLFIGEAGAYARLERKLEGQPVNLVGRMSLQRVARRGARNADTGELRTLFAYTQAERVIVESHALPPGEMHDLIRTVKRAGVRVSLLPQVFDVVGTSVVMDEMEGMTLLGVRRFGLSRSSALVKRAFDLTGSLVLLLAVAPLMGVIALAIKLECRGRGPVLFRQERVGRDGRRFRICKFRTMCIDAEERKAELRAANEVQGGLFKIADDPRITRVGRILRKTSLDELPQLFNVVGGDMSLVGPRPLVVDEDRQITGHDRSRLALTPGMTGHWQILGSARVPLPEMVKIDYLYVAGWTLWADIKILLRTVPYMLSRRGM